MTEAWELTFYDDDADDNRGMTRSIGVYHHRENAQAEADRMNAKLLAAYNDKAERLFQDRLKAVTEHNALVELGFRSGQMPLPTQPEPRTTRPVWGVPEREVGDWWEVGPFEFDWMDEA